VIPGPEECIGHRHNSLLLSSEKSELFFCGDVIVFAKKEYKNDIRSY
jgi:hypothetical protein